MPSPDFNDAANHGEQPVQLVRKLFLAGVAAGDVNIVGEVLKSHPEAANWGRAPFPFRSFAESVTALMVAAENGHAPVVRMLLQAGANGNAQQSRGWTALMYAAERGHKEVVDALLEHSVDTALKNESGDTASVMAAKRFDYETARRINDALKIFGLSKLSSGAGRPVNAPATARWKKKP